MLPKRGGGLLARKAPASSWRVVVAAAGAILGAAPPALGARQVALGRSDGQAPGGGQRRWLSRAAVALLGLAGSGAQQLTDPAVLFDGLDENGDGVVDRIEFMCQARDKMDDIGQDDKSRRTGVYDYVGKLYDAGDLNGDGVLDRTEAAFTQYLAGEEAQRHMTRHSRSDGPDFGAETARRQHRMADTNGDGVVDAQELANIFDTAFRSKSGHKFELKEYAEQVFVEADRVKSDGMLDWREFQFASFRLTDFFVNSVVTMLTKVLDRDQDGRIELREVTASIADESSDHHGHVRSIAEKALNSFHSVDQDKDGLLEGVELKKLAIALVLSARV